MMRSLKIKSNWTMTVFPRFVLSKASFSAMFHSYLSGRDKDDNIISQSWREGGHFAFALFLETYNVCIVWGRSKPTQCKDFDVTKIVIPDSPNNVTCSYSADSKEYVFTIAVPYKGNDYLLGKMNHELVLRKEGRSWPDCKDETYTSGDHKMCFKNIKDNLYVSKRNLEYSTRYEARARSLPVGGYYDGTWSPWSAVTTFQTEEEEADEGYVAYTLPVALSISLTLFLLVFVIIIAVFWKSRIKPILWPEIPDHKKTLEKLCNKPKQNLHISFNPAYYEITPIHKIDYIKAQVIPEDHHEMGPPESCMEKSAFNTCSTPPCPAEGSRGPTTDGNNMGPDPADNGENTLEEQIISATMALLPGDGEKCNASSGIMSVAIKHPGHGLKGLCWEDIYIAMSAFKTPGNAVKQLPKNNL
ncbi:interleukin-7 receptor subunit alpha isoform X2 [Engystomops pustulosus]|uniref:interleukin-7 receptor subunit alpha isoform X2 n=1 Tax=Engystomops pustulosus TaxID=76066 RepID=UPI003AFAFDF1